MVPALSAGHLTAWINGSAPASIQCWHAHLYLHHTATLSHINTLPAILLPTNCRVRTPGSRGCSPAALLVNPRLWYPPEASCAPASSAHPPGSGHRPPPCPRAWPPAAGRSRAAARAQAACSGARVTVVWVGKASVQHTMPGVSEGEARVVHHAMRSTAAALTSVRSISSGSCCCCCRRRRCFPGSAPGSAVTLCLALRVLASPAAPTSCRAPESGAAGRRRNVSCCTSCNEVGVGGGQAKQERRADHVSVFVGLASRTLTPAAQPCALRSCAPLTTRSPPTLKPLDDGLVFGHPRVQHAAQHERGGRFISQLQCRHWRGAHLRRFTMGWWALPAESWVPTHQQHQPVSQHKKPLPACSATLHCWYCTQPLAAPSCIWWSRNHCPA